MLKEPLNMKVTVITVVVRALAKISKRLKKTDNGMLAERSET